MKKNLLLLMAILLMPTFALTTIATPKEKKEKKEKAERRERAPYVWDWDRTLSGNADVDKYLLECDTLWYKIQEFSQAYEAFTFHQDTFMVNNKLYIMAYMLDGQGQLVTRKRSNWQITNSSLDATNLVLYATNVNLAMANATLALPSLGLNGLLFARYVKSGPALTGLVNKNVKEIAKINKINGRTFRVMSKGAIDPESLGVFSEDAVKKMKRCCYIKELIETDETYTAVITTQKEKSEEQLAQEIASLNNTWETTEVLPEDESKSLDDIDNIDDLD